MLRLLIPVLLCACGLLADPVDICQSVVRGAARRVTIRGVAMISAGQDGLTAFDYTCPVGIAGAERVPAMIHVAIQSFESQRQRTAFEKMSPVHYAQIVARGDLRCRTDFKIVSTPSGDFFANGYGADQMAKCALEDATLLDLTVLPTLVAPRKAPGAPSH